MFRRALLATTFTVLSALPAWGHGDLQSTTPSDGQRVKKPPRQVTIELTEIPTENALEANVRDGCNDPLPVAVSVVRSRIVLALEGGEPGEWVVRYRAVSSVDEHQTRGQFQFTVEGAQGCETPEPEDDIAAEDPPGIIQNPDPPGEGSFSLLWFVLAGALVLAGITFVVQTALDARVGIVLLVAGLVVLGGSFTFLRGGEAPTMGAGREGAGGDPEDVVLALCAVRDGADEIDAANSTFQDRAHGPLHDLVTAVQDEDRELAARLLIAKQAVESGLSSEGDPEQLIENIERLIAVTGDARQTVGMGVPEC